MPNAESRLRLSRHASRALLLIFLLLIFPLSAEPEWWSGPPKSLLAQARQDDKRIVLYFESHDSPDCLRMNSETWPMIDAKSASQFLWMRCMSGDSMDANFFNAYEISITPAMVVLDGERRELGRLQGFIAPDVILGQLEQLPGHDSPDSDTIFTFGDGLIFTAEQIRDPEFNLAQHLSYLDETFDTIASIGDLQDESRYDLILNPERSAGIVAEEGIKSTPALKIANSTAVQSATFGATAVVFQINLSTEFDELDLKTGHVVVSFGIRVPELPPISLTEVFALTLTPSDQKPPSVEDIQGRYRESSRLYPRSGQHTHWARIELSSARPVHTKSEAVWLTFWVNGVSSAYIIDDLRVRLMTEAQIKASLSLEGEVSPVILDDSESTRP